MRDINQVFKEKKQMKQIVIDTGFMYISLSDKGLSVQEWVEDNPKILYILSTEFPKDAQGFRVSASL